MIFYLTSPIVKIVKSLDLSHVTCHKDNIIISMFSALFGMNKEGKEHYLS